MLIAMFAGMAVLGGPAMLVLGEAPAAHLLAMGVTMTVPMVAWMRYRGHGWQPSYEMAASMMIPTAGVIGLLGAGLVTDLGSLMMIEHVVMLPAMLVAMLLRREEYTQRHDHGHDTQEEVALA
jgi:hypothetical protein